MINTHIPNNVIFAKNKLNMRKLVIFDLDGTLLYTLEDLMNSVNFTLDLFGYETCTLEEISSYVGNGVQQLLVRALPSDIDDKEFELCYACFKDHYSKHCCEKTRPYDGIMEVLRVLKSRGIKVGIVSNKYQSAAEDVCEHYFDGLYDMVVGESEYCRKKPSSDGIDMIRDRFDISNDETIFFGDTEVDIKTGDNAGVYCVSVLWGFRDRTFLARNGAHLFIENPLDIIDMLD